MKRYLYTLLIFIFSVTLSYATPIGGGPVSGGGGGAGATVSDDAYNALTWDNNTDAASKNAIRDKIETLAGGHDAVTIGIANGLSLSTQALSLAAATNATPGAATAAQITALEAATTFIATIDTEAEFKVLYNLEIGTDVLAPAGDGSSLTGLQFNQFITQTAWRVFYSDGSGEVTELALGADGTYLKSNGAAAAPTFDTPAGSGDVSKVGTPVDNQVGVWTGNGTIEGSSALTFDGTDLATTGAIGANNVNPDTANGATLGTAALEWSDLFLADGGVIYGQADQSATLTSSSSLWTANNFAVTTQFKLPSSNADPTATAGYLRHDSTVTGLETGALAWHDGDEIRYLVDLDVLPSDDSYVVAYNATDDKFYMKVDSTGAGGDQLVDIVTTAPLTINAGANLNDALPGSDADITFAISAATTDAAGSAELSTDAESVTGTSDAVVVTPGTLTARLAAPGEIGGTTPAAGHFTTLSTTSGVSTAGTADGGQFLTLLEDTDNGAHYAGWGVYGDIVASYLLVPPLAVSAGGQCMVFAAPGNQTMSDGSTKSVSVGTWVTPLTAAANTIDSDQYVDGSIDNIHLSSDAVLPTVISGDPDSLDDTLATNPKLYRGGFIRYNAAGEATLDAFSIVGETVSIMFYPSVAIIVNPNGSQTIVRNGVTLTAAEALINDSNYGLCVLTYLGGDVIDAQCSTNITEETP